ncbi:DUF7312 domain-containing protein [Halobacterium rubrum]|uniref:DUF7312 domain-containing protein n=1 Tax=Halobacterium TaxID=2239 RepID=UPI001F39B460|nr:MULTISPECIES: hypothetical protein [Halobacterium]MDH5021625.1 hypothetical protein [Halobacterium rubrum]
MSETDDGSGGENAEGEWRFGLDEVGEEADLGPDPIEPGSPSVENVAFFLLGVATMAGAIALLLFG